mmetsp:Transcript_79304/g.232959  ORF Transcript_79304/g.232959 Transcript_79304/m.232959 type:complete len:246 (+) Transcript_79304:85-822(+)
MHSWWAERWQQSAPRASQLQPHRQGTASHRLTSHRAALGSAPEGEHAEGGALAASLGRGFLLLKGWVVEQLLQDLVTADAVGQRQVAHRCAEIVDELVWPVAVLPLAGEPRHLLRKLGELRAAGVPDLALRHEAKLALTVVLPQALHGVHVLLRHVLDLGKVDPAALPGRLPRNLDEQPPRLGVRGLEVSRSQGVPEGGVVEAERGGKRGPLRFGSPAHQAGAAAGLVPRRPPHSCCPCSDRCSG